MCIRDREQVLPQHPDMARLHPSSVNTMRILTDLVDGEVHVAYISVKMGRGDGYLSLIHI